MAEESAGHEKSHVSLWIGTGAPDISFGLRPSPHGDVSVLRMVQVYWLEVDGSPSQGGAPVAFLSRRSPRLARSSYSGGAAPDFHRLPLWSTEIVILAQVHSLTRTLLASFHLSWGSA